MKRNYFYGVLAVFALAALAVSAPRVLAADTAGAKDWAMNATIIEACSCPMFCPCYFGTEPAAHHEHGSAEAKHFCRFNNAFKVNKGHWGASKLDGAKFWVAGDLGDTFGDGEIEWAIVTFDPSVTKEQREGIATIVGHVYPVKIKSMKVAADTPIEWTATKDRAEARMDGGKTAEVVLVRYPGNTDDPIVIKNLRYFGVPRNDGFILMPNEIETYRGGDHPFVFKGTNGFMITIDIKSSDVMASKASMGAKAAPAATTDAAPAVAVPKVGMRRFMVVRTFPAGALEGLDSAAKKAVNETNTTKGVRWIHSYANADKTKTFCIYEGPSEMAVREAAGANKIPADYIVEIPVVLTPY